LVRAASDSVNPSWSRDGNWIYFASNRTGQWQIWKISSGGGAPLQVTKNGGFWAFEAGDGKSIYYAKSPSDSDIWRMRFEDGQEAPVSPRIHLPQWRDWALVDKGIFFRGEASSRPVLKFLDLNTARTWNVLTLEKPSEWFSATPDGRFVLYQQGDSYESHIMLLEGFR
jgi:Tol biopolymer transport system component